MKLQRVFTIRDFIYGEDEDGNWWFVNTEENPHQWIRVEFSPQDIELTNKGRVHKK